VVVAGVDAVKVTLPVPSFIKLICVPIAKLKVASVGTKIVDAVEPLLTLRSLD
jgi:hypothetical protein